MVPEEEQIYHVSSLKGINLRNYHVIRKKQMNSLDSCEDGEHVSLRRDECAGARVHLGRAHQVHGVAQVRRQGLVVLGDLHGSAVGHWK